MGSENCLLRPTAKPSMATPIPKRIQTNAVGTTYWRAILVATKEAPQAVTAKRALRIAFMFILLWGNFTLTQINVMIKVTNGFYHANTKVTLIPYAYTTTPFFINLG